MATSSQISVLLYVYIVVIGGTLVEMGNRLSSFDVKLKSINRVNNSNQNVHPTSKSKRFNGFWNKRHRPVKMSPLIQSVNDSPFIESSKLDVSDEEFAKQQRQVSASCPISSVGIISYCAVDYLSTSTSFSTDAYNGVYTIYYFTCSSSSTSAATCTSLSSSCDVTCTSVYISSTGYTYTCIVSSEFNLNLLISTEISTSNNLFATSEYACDALTVACSLSSSITSCTSSFAALETRAVVAAAVAFGSGVGLGIGADRIAVNNLIDPTTVQFANAGAIAGVPGNNLQIPVQGQDFPNPGGCNNASVLYQLDGRCYPVLRQGPCVSPLEWITVDPRTLLGRCSPRICGKDQVFVGRDGLCHDIYDPNECQGGRRLYYTAYGDPICDCRIGHFPFPQPENDCVALFTQGPCPFGQIVAFSRNGELICSPQTNLRRVRRLFSNRQIEINEDDNNEEENPVQLAKAADGLFYALGSRGPCPAMTSSPISIGNPLSTSNRRELLFGYDVFQLKAVCVDVLQFDSPYFNPIKENQLFDNAVNRLTPLTSRPSTTTLRRHQRRIDFISQNKSVDGNNGKRRQGALTSGLFQVPGSLPNPLLSPCRPGAQKGNNYKCTNPHVPKDKKKMLLQAVRGSFSCSGNAAPKATGQCGRGRSASCGPSFEYEHESGECLSIFDDE